MNKKFITVKFNKGASKKFLSRIDKANDIAISRALNILSKRGISMTSKEVRDDTGIPVGILKKEIRVKKATRRLHRFEWSNRSSRLKLVKPKMLKSGGLSFAGDGKKRKKIKGSIDGGSKPFIIKVNPNSKGIPTTNLAVYRTKGSKKKVRRLSWHTLAYLLRRDWHSRVLIALTKGLKVEYKNQVKKARFRG